MRVFFPCDLLKQSIYPEFRVPQSGNLIWTMDSFQIDVFTITAIDLGDLTKVKVTKGSSTFPWQLSKITVRKGPLGPVEEIFLCEK